MAESTPVRSTKPHAGNTLEVSARKKVLLLGQQLGLGSEGDYRAANASIVQRANFRAQKLASQYQANVEAIHHIAIAATPSDITGMDLDPDWVHQFYQLAEQIHNHNMQTLWGRILAREITSPGQFSLRSLITLKQLTHKEAQLFEKALSMAVKLGEDDRFKLLIGYRHTGGIGQLFRNTTQINLGLSQFGLPYSAILTLIEAGLLHRSEFETGMLAPKESIAFTLGGTQKQLRPRRRHLQLSYYRLTSIGDELAQLVKPKTEAAYLNAIQALFNKHFSIS